MKNRYWLRQLDKGERLTLIATFAGWALDGMTVMIYTFALPTLMILWRMSTGKAGLLGTSALIFSSIGGWLAGLAADRWGRVRILQLTIIWFAVFTFLSGCTSSFTQLLVVRGLQGLGFGGEWAVGAILIGERIRPAFRGRAVGTTQAGWAIGWALALAFFALFFRFLPPALAWRALFWVGLLPALLAVRVKRHVTESEIYTRRKSREAPAHFLAIFSPAILPTTALASLVALGAQAGYYALYTFLPLYLNTRGLSLASTSTHLVVVIAGSFAGYLSSAHLADRLGRKPALLLFAAGSLVTVTAYMALPLSPAANLLLGFPLGFFPSGTFSPLGSFFTELFPTAVRGSGQGFSYNFGRGIGALFPALVGYASAILPLRFAIAWFAGSAYALMVAGVLLLPETRSRSLDDLDRQADI